MNDRRTPVKASLLMAPLLVAVLGLHAWGDAMAGGLGRAVGRWQYPERTSQSSFVIRVPRRSDAHGFAAPALEEFVSKSVKAYGVPLTLQRPAQPVTVVLLDADTDLRRFGPTVVDELNPNEGVFDPARRTIFVRMERKIDQKLVIAALQETAARALLHDAGSARWSPWLSEGLVGRLEGKRIVDLRGTGEILSVTELLSSRPSEYGGHNAAAYTRSAKLLVAFLMEQMPEKFFYYYKEARAGQGSFADRIGDPVHVDLDWKDWIQRQR